jgi:regulatory protein YycI of two-component signal transduction system YycFG
MNTGPKPAKTKSILIYSLIVMFFLLLIWLVWMFFDSKIKEAESKKGYSSNIEIKNTATWF